MRTSRSSRYQRYKVAVLSFALAILIILFVSSVLAGCGKRNKEYVRRFPITVIEPETDSETETAETETSKEETEETIVESNTEADTESGTEPTEYYTEEPEEIYSEEQDSYYLGFYELTAYTHTGNCMANGEYPYVGACACNSLDLGTVVYIDGYGTFTVCDRGGMPDNVIDIFMDTYDECVEFGRRSADVYIVE